MGGRNWLYGKTREKFVVVIVVSVIMVKKFSHLVCKFLSFVIVVVVSIHRWYIVVVVGSIVFVVIVVVIIRRC
jgi:hypothetical protein